MDSSGAWLRIDLVRYRNCHAWHVKHQIRERHAAQVDGLGVQHLNDSGRGDLVTHIAVETPLKLDEAQEALLKQLAALRGEETPPGRFAPGQQGFFSRLRDAFNGR